MRFSFSFLPALCVAASVAYPSAAHAYSQRDAIRDCERHLQRSYHYRPRQVHDVSVRRQGRGSFEIHGKLDIENASDPKFVCIVHHREVVSVRVNDSTATAEAIGKGILGAVLGGIASSLERAAEEGERGQRHPAYAGQGSPFRNRAHLRNACRHELRRHIHVGHGPVERIRITNAHLHGRTLDGDGVIRWQNGRHQRMHFTCHFDRRGRIHDGRYSYYGSTGGSGNSQPAQRPDGDGGVMAQVRRDCVRAVRRQDGERSASVLDSNRGANIFTVRVNVQGAQAPWICEHSSRSVMRVYYGAEG